MAARKPPIGAPPSPSSVTSSLVLPTLRRLSAVMSFLPQGKAQYGLISGQATADPASASFCGAVTEEGWRAATLPMVAVGCDWLRLDNAPSDFRRRRLPPRHHVRTKYVIFRGERAMAAQTQDGGNKEFREFL